ncbi:MAG: hypothetical protein WC593_15135 [Methanoregula sp.]
MDTNTEISAGEVIVLTKGEYSDYGINGYIVSLIDFDMQDAIDVFNKLQLKGDDWDIHTKFVAWLVSTERCVPVEHREIHIGSYGDLAIS